MEPCVIPPEEGSRGVGKGSIRKVGPKPLESWASDAHPLLHPGHADLKEHSVKRQLFSPKAQVAHSHQKLLLKNITLKKP